MPFGCDVIDLLRFSPSTPTSRVVQGEVGVFTEGRAVVQSTQVLFAREEHMRLGVGKLMGYRVGMDSARRKEEVVFTDSSRSERRFAGLADSRYLLNEFSCASLRGWHRPPLDHEGLWLECSSLVWMLG